MSGFISFLLLTVVGSICVVGIFWKGFHDSILERVGMSLLAIWCLGRLPDKMIYGYTEPIHLVLHFGLFCMAVGMAWEKYHHCRKESEHDPA